MHIMIFSRGPPLRIFAVITFASNFRTCQCLWQRHEQQQQRIACAYLTSSALHYQRRVARTLYSLSWCCLRICCVPLCRVTLRSAGWGCATRLSDCIALRCVWFTHFCIRFRIDHVNVTFIDVASRRSLLLLCRRRIESKMAYVQKSMQPNIVHTHIFLYFAICTTIIGATMVTKFNTTNLQNYTHTYTYRAARTCMRTHVSVKLCLCFQAPAYVKRQRRQQSNQII